MKVTIKILLVVVALGLIFAIEFALVGDYFELILNQERCLAWFAGMKSVAWAVGILLLVSDILLPIPASGVIAALGSVYGVWMGALFGSVGVISGAYVGYFIARFAGLRWIHCLASEEELIRFQVFFDRWGGWAIIASRIMPILPEVLVLLAGMARMKHARFAVAVILGALPVCFLFSYVGFVNRQTPWSGIALATIMPLIFWPLIVCVQRKLQREPEALAQEPAR